MRAQSAMFRRAFRSEVEPGAGFYARVMNRIETQAKPSVWSLFGESMFAKRLAYASATFLVLVGVVFVSVESARCSHSPSADPADRSWPGDEQIHAGQHGHRRRIAK